MSQKFNTILPETDDQTLCVMIDRLITAEGYEKNLIPRLEKMIAEYGKIRVLVYYKKFAGWEEAAASHDMALTARYGKNVHKIALVNPPKSEIFQRKLKQPITSGEMRMFNDNELQKAIEWVKF